MKKLLTVLAAIALAVAFTAPAMADWNFYGSARMTTFYQDTDPGKTNLLWTGPQLQKKYFDDSDGGTTFDLQGNARIGATVKSGDIGGGFEYGHGPNPSLRKLYGTYDFGAGQLLIGQTYTPCASFFYSNQVYASDEDLLSFGQFYNGRDPMIQLSMSGFKIALVKPQYAGTLGVNRTTFGYGNYRAAGTAGTTSVITGGTVTAGSTIMGVTNKTAADQDVILPQLELSYGMKTEMFFFDVFAGYHTFEVESNIWNTSVNAAGTDTVINASSSNSYDIDAYVIGLGGGFNAGPFYMKASAFYAVNGQQLGMYTGLSGVNAAPMYVEQAPTRLVRNATTGVNDVYYSFKDEVIDTTTFGYMLVMGVKAGDALTFEVGYGYIESELDDDVNYVDQYWDTTINAANNQLKTYDSDSAWSLYVNATINITDGFFIVPEFGFIDFEENRMSVEEGDLFYIGAKWQINF